MCVCDSFQAKQAALTFLAQISPKVNLGLAIQKTVVKIRISTLDIPCVPMLSQNEQLWIFRHKFVQKNLEFETKKNNVGIRINIVETLCVPIFSQTRQLWLFWPKFAQRWILGSEFQKSKSGFGICTSNIPCVPIFS